MLGLIRLSLASSILIILAPLIVSSQDVVDFSRPPKVGLKFRVVEETTIEGEGRTVNSDSKPTVSKGRATTRCAYTQVVHNVKDGQVVRLERSYDPYVPPESPKQDTTRKHGGHPSSGKRLRATWDEFGCHVEEEQDGKWMRAPRTWLRGRELLHPQILRFPLIPLPSGKLRIGDSWQLGFELNNLYFPTMDFAIRPDKPGWTWDVVYKLTDIKKHDGMQCAVIQARARIRGPSFLLKADLTAWYSLTHRIVVALDFDGYREMKIGRVESIGTEIRSARVTILEPDREPHGRNAGN